MALKTDVNGLPHFSILDVEADFFPNVTLDKVQLQEKIAKNFFDIDMKYKRDLIESLSNDNCPFLPDYSEQNWIVDTSIPVKLNVNGYSNLKDTLLIMCKVKQSQLGAPTPEFVTNETIEKALRDNVNTGIIESERANGVPSIFTLHENPENKDEITGYKIVTYYNICQLKNPYIFRNYLEKVFLQNRKNAEEHKYEKYGENAWASKQYTSFPKYVSMTEEPTSCSAEDPYVIMSQYILAGMRKKPLSMNKVTAKALHDGLLKILNDKEFKGRAVADFGKKVGVLVKYSNNKTKDKLQKKSYDYNYNYER